MTTLRLEVDDLHAVLTKVLAMARMNEIRIARISCTTVPDTVSQAIIDMEFDDETLDMDPLRIDRVIARACGTVGVITSSSRRVPLEP